MPRRAGLCFVLVAVQLTFAAAAWAQNDPEAGYFESEGTCAYCAVSPFNWEFADQWGSYYYYNIRETTPAVHYYVPSMYVENVDNAGCGWGPYLNGANDYHVDYADEGFHTSVLLSYPDDQWCDYPDVSFQGYAYIPSAGGNFARLMYKVTNTGAEQATFNINMNGYPMYTGLNETLEVVETGDGDNRVEPGDRWFTVDDDDGSGQPVAAVVWAAEGAEEQADTATVTTNAWGDATMDLRFTNVVFEAGETKTFGVFLIQAETRDQAALDAEDASDMGGAASDFLDVGDVETSLANFIPGDPTGPRLRSNGPYACDEGGSVQLGITVEDRDGEGTVSFSWDFNGDGVYGDSPDVTNPVIDCLNADGSSSIRSGIRLTDDEGIVEDRTVSVSVRNVAPVITSTPATTATTNQEYTYQITQTDIAADTFTYEVDEGPAGMTITAGGLLRWTVPANGIGPDVPVQIIVSDDDGGEAEQAWVIGMRGGPVVNPGGPYRVAEGDTVQLTITAFDPENPDDPDAVTYAWDLDSDGVFDDSTEPSVLWSAAGIDGPADGFVVHVVVADGEFDVQADIPVEVTNAPPVFVSVPSATATIDREWTYTAQAVDPGDDPFEISVDEDELPLGMAFDPVTASFAWTPNEGHLLTGEPPGHYCFTVTAEDEDRGRGRQEVCITIGENSAPPVPPIKYPDGTEPVHTPNPTVILDNVDDPDGDAVQYYVQVDTDPCFCGPELQASGPMTEGPLVTSFAIPRPFNVDVAAGGHTKFYVRRWASDGLADSAQELSLFDYEPGAGGDGDADIDGDSDTDSDTDSDSDSDDTAGCACRTAGSDSGSGPLGLLASAAVVGLTLARRRRRS